MNKLKTAQVYNYKNGIKQQSVPKYIIKKFSQGYLCPKSNKDFEIGFTFDTEWYSFKEKK